MSTDFRSNFRSQLALLTVAVWLVGIPHAMLTAQQTVASSRTERQPDFLREMQAQAINTKQANWVHWGDRSDVFSNWTEHSNRLIPVYTFGTNLKSYSGRKSCYRDPRALTKLYGQLPQETLNPTAEYFDQTDLYKLQKKLLRQGKKNVILMIFDGMDWQTTQAASIYKNRKILYTQGKGQGLSFLDYNCEEMDFGYCVTSPHNINTVTDVNAQAITQFGGKDRIGGYSPIFGGEHPWSLPGDPSYLLGRRKSVPHPVTKSAAAATAILSGKKTFNSSVNIDPQGNQLKPIAHQYQRSGRSIGIVTSVPISHATPACCYAQNVARVDYQDLTRDLLGLKSISHRQRPFAGVDVLIGCGWGEKHNDDRDKQGNNFISGNPNIAEEDLERIDSKQGGQYVVAQRTPGQSGQENLMAAAKKAVAEQSRLFGFFGVSTDLGAHLPFQTADGDFLPTAGIAFGEKYSDADIHENPTLADMTRAAIQVLETNENGFWLMIEPGDVDWANHNNNLDDSIGAVFSGEAAFDVVTQWVEANSSWDETALIVTADHGHMLVLEDPEALTGKK